MENLELLEKLLFLLQKFEKEKGNKKYVLWEIIEGELECTVNVGGDENLIDFPELLIISKEYKFIKRLVENDKIDLLRLDNRIALSEFNKVERVLMALSISETPIEFLVSVLK